MPAYTPILATLGYIMSPDSTQVLMIHRNARIEDQHYGKYNGLGGKLEPGEDVVSGMKREIHEEAGIVVEQIVLRGTINWPGFGKNGEDWFAFVFRIDRWSGTPYTSNPEGSLEWVPVASMMSLNLWESDRFWLPMVFEQSAQTFHGIAPFEQQRCLSWDYKLV